MAFKQASARARSNIALVKYWGKRDPHLNLPATGSLSITLDALDTVTTVVPDDQIPVDQLTLNDQPADSTRLSAWLDRWRELAGQPIRFRVISRNSFPTAAGLASSASAYAALAIALDQALGLGLPPDRLSELARLGSGSAARSIFGGFVEMARGERPDGRDAVARQLHGPQHWPLAVVVAVTDERPKSVSSTDGMNHTMQTSPYYPAWIEQVERDLNAARQIIAERDFERLAGLAEGSALAMHASALAARPGVIYFQPATLACIERVRSLRADGIGVCFTIDAGPQLKAICLPEAADRVAAELAAVDGVQRVIRSGLGSGAELIA